MKMKYFVAAGIMLLSTIAIAIAGDLSGFTPPSAAYTKPTQSGQADNGVSGVSGSTITLKNGTTYNVETGSTNTTVTAPTYASCGSYSHGQSYGYAGSCGGYTTCTCNNGSMQCFGNAMDCGGG